MPVERNISPIRRFKMTLLDSRRFHIPFLLVVAFLTRTGIWFHLDTVTLGWRQADLSSIAMNYLNNGFRFFYPQIDWGGAGPGYVEMEFPIIPYLTALLYRVFGVHDACALVIPFICGIGVVVAIYLFTRRLCDSAVGLVAALIAACSPLLSLASQTLLGEPALILCTILSVHFLLRWTDSDQMRDLVLSALLAALAALLKLTALYVGLPLLTLFIVKLGRGIFRSVHFWLFAVLALLPVLLWYVHSHSLYVEYGNTFGILSGGYNKFARSELLLSPEFYMLMTKRILLSVSTPMVFVFFLFGLFQRPTKPVTFVLHTWTAALVIYTLLIAEGNKDMIYYQLPWLPAVAVLGSVGVFSIFEGMGRLRQPLPPGRQRTAITVVCGLLVVSVVGVAVRSVRVPITVLENEARIRTHAEEVRRATPEGSLIVVATSYGNGKTPRTIDTPPQMFYFSKRQGWYQALAWLTPHTIDSLQAEGANYLVVFDGDVENFRSHTPLFSWLLSKASPRIARPDLLVLPLAQKRAQ